MDKEQKKHIILDLLGQKPIISNYFNYDIADGDELYYSSKSAILRCCHEDYSRLFIVSNDEQDTQRLFLQMPTDKYVVNYPAKAPNEAFDALLISLGFKHIKTYRRMSTTRIRKMGNVDDIQYANEKEVEDIMNLLTIDTRFVNYLDYLPQKEELKTLITKKQVLINRENNAVKGVIIYEVYGKRYYFRVWLDKSGNGMKLLFDLYTLIYEQGGKYAYWWVDSENTQVIAIHQALRSKFDGLNDYIFINR